MSIQSKMVPVITEERDKQVLHLSPVQSENFQPKGTLMMPETRNKVTGMSSFRHYSALSGNGVAREKSSDNYY